MNKSKENLRYFLYVRKSTETEDRQIQSIDDQIDYMKRLAKQDGLKIIGEPICERKSAKTPFERPLFTQMLEDIKNGDADGILTWKLDRLSRNPAENGIIQQMLQDQQIKHIRTAEDNHYPEDNAIVFSVKAGMSNQYIRELAMNTKRGMASKAEKGGKNGTPPIGYLNDVINKTIIDDPDQFSRVRMLWDKMLTGTYIISQLTRLADEELHLKIPKRGKLGGKAPAYSSICAMFHNDFYRGKIRFNGNLFEGKHNAMVTDEEFFKVQQIIDPHAPRPKNKERSFQFSKLFKCGECGYAITAEQKDKTLKRDGNAVSYIYYHCTGKSKQTKCSQPTMHITEDELEKQIKDKLNSFTIDPDFYKLAISVLADEEDAVVAENASITKSRDIEIKQKTNAINNLRRMRYNGEADDDSWYFSELASLESELAHLQDLRNQDEYKAVNWRAKADEVFTFARYAKEDFDSDDIERKRAVVAGLGESLTIVGRTIQFTPNKYFVPLEKLNIEDKDDSDSGRTDNSDKNQTLKSKETSGGSLASVSVSGISPIQFSSWLRRLDSNQRPRS